MDAVHPLNFLWGCCSPGSCTPPPTSYHKLSLSPVVACINIMINVFQTCRNLGVMLDCNMTMSHEIYSICKSVRCQLRNIGFIRKYLTRSATENWFMLWSPLGLILEMHCYSIFHNPIFQTAKAPKCCSTYYYPV